MTTRKIRRAVTASILFAASCNVYNPSLLTGHGGNPGSGDTGGGGQAGGSAGTGSPAGNSGRGGTNTAGSGGTAGRASGGASGTAGATAGRSGSAGGSGTESVGGGAGEGGQAGEMGQGGTVNAGTGGGGTSGAGGMSAGTSGTAGTGGTEGGSAGTSGAGGSAGTAAGMGGTAGTTGGAGAGGSAGGNEASGCANLSVPLTQTGDKAHFVITLTTAANMTTGTIAMRVYVPAGLGGVINNYVQDTGNHFLPPAARTALSSIVSTWTNLQWNVGNEAPGSSSIDKTNIKRIGIEVAGTGSTSWTNPTKVYVDSITVTAATSPPAFTFDMSGSVTSNASNGVDVGGQVLWLNSASSDTSASGVTLGWLATCP